MIRATSILAALSFAAIAGAQPAKPAKPATVKHDSVKAKIAAPAVAHAAAPAMKHDTTKKAAAKLKKPGV